MTGTTVTAASSTELPPQESGPHERHLAAGSMAQQFTLVVGTLTMFAVITALGRTLSLSEFGAYGLLISIPTYLLFAQASVETVAIRAIAQARDQIGRDRAFTTALSLYAFFGLLASICIVFGGTALLGLFDIAPSLHQQARLGLEALGVVNLLGWPVKTVQDSLRGSGRFVMAAFTESLGFMTCGVLMLAALLLSAPLWLIVGLGGAISLMTGLCAGLMLLFLGMPVHVRPSTLSLPYTRSLLSASLILLLSGVADLVIYSIDRTILGAYRPVATVGLYEGPIRAHNLLRSLQGALALTVMPAAAGYVACGDNQRLRELLVRGTRYTAIVMMPFTVVFMTLARPILEVWLGPHFAPAAGAMTILVSYWLLLGGSSVGLGMMIAAGRLKTIILYSTTLAVLNLSASLALTPPLGLDGVVLGTSLPYALMLPVFVFVVCRTFGVPIVQYLREGFLLAFAAGSALAGAELCARSVLPVEQPLVLLSTIVLGLLGYVLLVYRIGLAPRERLLVRTTLTAARERFASLPQELSMAWSRHQPRASG